MSYSLSVEPEARAALTNLDPWLAEETLDEIELLLRNPEGIHLRAGETVAVHDFVRTSEGATHYVFLVVRPVRQEARLEVLSIGSVRR